ncbi:helicase [Zobellia amurskyensis]|uniref:Helicase n=1 Tax=Zobellia amurskyensis TaxID=248905 RepID=A0A7X3D055_9FLAO|nr:primase-helicase family protein [Zobellia amurskyensis]MUH34789.1 helicase [Zobellia amurskyensis]
MNNSKYLRIGTEYFKLSDVPLYSGDTYKTLLKWKKSEIITDEGKDFLKSIEKYDGFCLIPSNTDYQQSIKDFYNKYEKLEHDFECGNFTETEGFLRHIFGEQYELGLDYLTILWRYPTQILPILCLVSEDRKTGKTTFLNWLKLIFQGNMTINKNEDFRSRFNSDWASKLIVSVDEVLLDKKEDSERIKNLSTAVTYKTESKGIDKVESYFFGKFILCSNNEDNFIQVDQHEIRYWVIKVESIPDSNENPNLMEILKAELPQIMYYLNSREIMSPRLTRMWFTKDQIYTPALDKLVSGNKTYVNREIEEILIDDFVKFEVDELKYSLNDLVEKLSNNNIRVSAFKVSAVLKNQFGLKSKNGSYGKYYLSLIPSNNSFVVNETKHKGRYYTFLKVNYLKSSD